MRFQKFLLLLLAALGLSACQTATLSQTKSFDQKSSTGLVVVSLTQDEPLEYLSGHIMYGALDKPHFKSLETLSAQFINEKPLELIWTNDPVPSDIEGTVGKLFVAELEPNTYEITRYRYMIRGYPNYKELDILFKPIEKRPKFEIKAGEVTYLGEYNFNKYPYMKKSNKEERDIELLKKLYPNVDVTKITNLVK